MTLTLGLGHNNTLGHGQQLCELSKSYCSVKSYDLDINFDYGVHFDFELGNMTFSQGRDPNCLKYPDPTWQ